MKAYRVEILIIDFDKCGPEEIKNVIHTARYPNRCISPEVMSIEERDIGEWQDDHPLNMRATTESAYRELFSKQDGDRANV